MSEVWTQTYITVAKKDWQTDVEVREIQPEIVISASTPITISKEDFIHETLRKHVIDPKILKAKSVKDAQNQTYLQGVPIVTIGIQQKDEVSQTTYIGYPSKEYLTMISKLKYKKIYKIFKIYQNVLKKYDMIEERY
jgi:hypothetical protein